MGTELTFDPISLCGFCMVRIRTNYRIRIRTRIRVRFWASSIPKFGVWVMRVPDAFLSMSDIWQEVWSPAWERQKSTL